MDFGVVVEGVVELDPMTGRMVLRTETEKGFEYTDVQAVLERYKGEEVRFIVAPFQTINQLAQMVEEEEISLEGAPKAGSFKQ